MGYKRNLKHLPSRGETRSSHAKTGNLSHNKQPIRSTVKARKAKSLLRASIANRHRIATMKANIGSHDTTIDVPEARKLVRSGAMTSDVQVGAPKVSRLIRKPVVWIDNTKFDRSAYRPWPNTNIDHDFAHHTTIEYDESDSDTDIDVSDYVPWPLNNRNHETHEAQGNLAFARTQDILVTSSDNDLSDNQESANDSHHSDNDSVPLHTIPSKAPGTLKRTAALPTRNDERNDSIGNMDIDINEYYDTTDVSGDLNTDIGTENDNIDLSGEYHGQSSDDNDLESDLSDDDDPATLATVPAISDDSFRSLPFFGEFRDFHSMEYNEARAILRSTKRLGYDVDRWEITMSPAFYYARFSTPHATVRLSCHSPRQKARSKDDPANMFDDWLLVAESVHLLYIDPRFKARFYTELKRTHIVRPSKFDWVSSAGGIPIPVRIFVDCLEAAGCSAIRLKLYGQKLPIKDRYLTIATPLADLEHPLAKYNEWDIGTTYRSPYIWLFSPIHGNTTKRIQDYAMVIPGSCDFGSIQITARSKGTDYRIKIYPRLVHVIKSINSRIEGEPPKTVQNIRRKGNAAIKMIRALSETSSYEMGGFRIEVSVRAPSFAEAQRLVHETQFLRPHTWISQSKSPYKEYVLNVKFVTKKGFLDNTNWVYHQAILHKAYEGRNLSAASKLQKQIARDVFGSFGWNLGRRPLTKSLAPNAWWRTIDNESEASPYLETLQALNRKYSADWAIKRLVTIVRTVGKGKRLPCRRAVDDPKHRYASKEAKPPRWQCSNPVCKDNLPTGEAMRWIAQLVMDGWVSRAALDLPPLNRQNDNRETPERITPPPESPPPGPETAFLPANRINRLRFRVPGPNRLIKLPVRPVHYSTKWIAGDGNCLFRAFARAYGDIDHRTARNRAVAHMRSNFARYEPFYSDDDHEIAYGDFGNYLNAMANDGEYGDQLVLQALSEYYHVAIRVLRRGDLDDYVWSETGTGNGERMIKLYYFDRHYENLIAHDEV